MNSRVEAELTARSGVGYGSIPFQAGAQGGGEVLRAGKLDTQLLHLLGGGPLIGPYALQQSLPLVGIHSGADIEAVGGLKPGRLRHPHGRLVAVMIMVSSRPSTGTPSPPRPPSECRLARVPGKVIIDLSVLHIRDASSVAALDAIETKYAQRGKTVEITGLNDPSARLHDRLKGELPVG